ncbi:phage major capsid protein [Pantoea sp. YU22]|uniref:phage major capsid protein n=1 Tax=Pantoea sp. YU22 TaxID=2497684 RepID=UPI000F8883EE|nr:phage major capsid protein [Pantoea sp. YU22]RTY53645.1 phage major capsid protein [Pantoea sp. YU22]
MKLHELYQKRNTIAGQMRTLNDQIGDNKWTPEQRSTWDAHKHELDQVSAQIAREEELRAIDQTFVAGQEEEQRRKPQSSEEEFRAAAFNRFLRDGLGELNPDERRALQELRAQAAGTNEKGGYTVPTQFRNRITDAMKLYGGIASVSQVLVTANGQPIEWAYSDGSAEEGALIGENEEAGEEDVSFTPVTLGAKKLTSKVIRVSNELLSDSGVDIEGYLAARIAKRIGRGEAKYLITGDGSNDKTPKGLATWVSKTTPTAKSTAFTVDEILALKHAVDPAYRNSPNFRFAFNDSTLLKLSQMKDGQGRPLWLPDVVGVAPATIANTQYVIDQGIADFGAGAKFMYCGDFQSFVIRRVQAMTLKRLVERYAEYDQTGFLAFHRFDCVLEDLDAIKALVGAGAAAAA